ncbi:hypothetical protein ACFO5Q_16040 [Kordiimonas lipolytica]|uniref:Porin n=1 Tax=Kordiimonas lipolytica TaxID=1662421 RepID=A0ABV8UFW0_9PROT|nr:hypothetical protein [Kordiimonas lipolytica]
MKFTNDRKPLSSSAGIARRMFAAGLMATTAMTATVSVQATDDDKLGQILARLERLEQENAALKREVNALKQGGDAAGTQEVVVADASERKSASKDAGDILDVDVVSINSNLSYKMLDPTTNINRKQELLLEARRSGELADNTVTLGGAVTAIADYWHSNTENKFGYLMRHPTPNNQQQKDVSEAVIHSAQLSVTATLGDWITTYAEMLYDPEQSFGAGTITALGRNQVQLRKGYVIVGNLEKSPVYLTLGKMATPFGLTDTVNPFTASTVWHAFGGLAYGAKVTYADNGLNMSFEAVQGGAQFRSANVHNNGTTVPSKLNNYVIDANYTHEFGTDGFAMVGGSYQRGTAYCQPFPVVHFTACNEVNPAWAAYGQFKSGPFLVMGEFAKTTKEWPGTFNPTPPLDVFAASKVTSFGIGGKYSFAMNDKPTDLSLEFSSFISGPEGSPWRRQDQWVLGLAHFLSPSIKGFAELVRTNGYAPLNFISGGNQAPGTTHSDIDANSTGIIIGVNAAF